MSARVLVVDDIAANVRLLQAKLTAEYYDVLTATDGREALELIDITPPDIVLLDVMMPGLNGFDVCKAIKGNPDTAHIPVVMVTALGEVRDRVRGLEAGADDFLTKPVQDLALFARIRSLVRLKRASEEFTMREIVSTQFDDVLNPGMVDGGEDPGCDILLVQDAPRRLCRIREALEPLGHRLMEANTIADAVRLTQEHEFHMFLVSDRVAGADALHFCAQLRANERTRNAAILLTVSEDDVVRLAKGLDLGVNDYLVRPVDRDELVARTRAQLRRKRYEDGLRANFRRSMAAAMVDSLTGLYNRRYLDAHFQAAAARAERHHRPISLLLLDVDRFKAINDTYGHAAGDEVLQGLAKRITASLRGFDTAVRLGGEEFVVLLPEVRPTDAVVAAERLREAIAARPFDIGEAPHILPATVSIGVAWRASAAGSLDELLRDADKALYEAKRTGRNKVVPQPGLIDDAPSRAASAH